MFYGGNFLKECDGEMMLKDVRSIVLSFYTDKGLRKVPIGEVGKRGLSQKTVDFLKEFVKFLLTTDFIGEEAKTYLVHDYWTFESVFSSPEFKDISESKIRYRLSISIHKINTHFGSNMLVELMDYRTDCGVYRNVLNGLKEKYSLRNRFKTNYVIKIPEAFTSDCVDMERVIKLIEQLKPFTKHEVDKLVKSVDMEALGYMYKLLAGTDLTDEEKKDRKVLSVMLFDFKED